MCLLYTRALAVITEIFLSYLCVGIQKRMEKDIDEVKNIALAAKSKLEDLEKDVWCFFLLWNHIFTHPSAHSKNSVHIASCRMLS